MSELSRFRVDLAYDGAPFAGFATQRDQVTVQGILEESLHRVLGQPITVTCAGRTDRGVHALAQVVHIDVDLEQSRARRALANPVVMRRRLDREVGPAITVWRVGRVGAGFDARFSAVRRQYRYRIVDLPLAPPSMRHDHWLVGARLSVTAMRAGSRWFIGEHDFTSFCRRSPGRSPIRTVERVAIHRPGPGRVHVRVAGRAFCHQQVRSMIGCLVEVGTGQRDPEWIGHLLADRDRRLAARVAPPQGLTLERVGYGRGWPSAPPPGCG